MITCPQCGSQQLSGTIFCSECSMQLAFADTKGTQTFPRGPASSDHLGQPGLSSAPAPEQGHLVVHLVDSGTMIPLEDKEEFTFGRLSDGQPVVPDVDLTAYRAHENGVSRLHAVVRFQQGHITITDLGSSNGTYINGARVLPNNENRISSGDLIALGKLRFQLVLTPE
jgi:pSer/pThr/pTyr-binding forkhead associated (FHA) protein